MPPPGAKLDDATILALAQKVRGPSLDALLTDLGGVIALDRELRKGRNLDSRFEIHGAKREELVKGIGAVRHALANLDNSSPEVSALVVAVNHKLEEIAPYHFQLNISSVESVGGWSTCNFTSLAMAMEAVGVNATAYAESKQGQLLAVASVFRKDIEGEAATKHEAARLTSAGRDASKMTSLLGLRLPDFLESAAIVHVLKDAEPTRENVINAADVVVGQKKYMSFIMGMIADFGLSATSVPVKWDADRKKNRDLTNKLSNYGDLHRGEHKKNKKVEELNTLKNEMDREPDPKKREALQKQYEDLLPSQQAALDGKGIEDLPVETYASCVKRDLALLDAGAGLLAGLSNHWTRLYAIDADGFRVQDPGEWNRSEMKISWAEGRAMGYFWTNWVVR